MKARLFLLTLLIATIGFAQADSIPSTNSDTTKVTDTLVSEVDTAAAAVVAEDVIPEQKKTELYAVIKEKFIEGGVGFMSVVLICLILGLAIAIERIIGLTIASTNTEKLLEDTKNALRNGGLEEAKAVTANVPGPVASIFTQGLMRYHKGVEAVEKSIIQYGGVEMGKLEKGMTWVALFIALAPMFGFMGTVIGMINAFDEIQQSETIKIDEVAGGIKQALLTTVAGLIVAVILQIVYNFCISKIDAIVNQMEEASINFVDMLLEEEEKGALKK